MTAATARLEARLPKFTHDLLKRAAQIQGRSLTDFVVTAAREEATRVIEQTEILRLSMEDQRRFAEALINPPPPTPAMIKARDRYAEMIEER